MARVKLPHRQSIRRLVATVAGVLVAALIAVPTAWASTPFTDIHSSGPLSDIYIGNDLGCQVRSGGFSTTEYFPNAAGPGDCGTFLFLNSDNVSGGLFGPDFANHAGGTGASFTQGETPFTSAGSQSFTGSGTAASPYEVTTTVTLTSPTGNTPVLLQLTEVDSYVVANDFYQTDVTVTNIGTVTPDNGGELYHAGSCFLRGSATGFGAFEPNSTSPNTAACTPNVLGTPPSALEEFVPITGGNSWEQRAVPALWGDLNGSSALLNECDNCRGTATDNGEAIEYPIPALTPGQSSSTISFETEIVDTVPAGSLSLTGTAGTPLSATVATITDPNTSATASAYSATINWGDGNSSAGTVTGANGSFTVTGTHTYATAGPYQITVTITAVGTTQGSTTVTDSATITPPAPTVTGVSPSSGPLAAGTRVTITGTNLASATAVKFGTGSATINTDTATSITATAPAGTAGTVDLTVTTAGGTSATSAADHYTYTSGPSVTSISPVAGPTAGGTSVAITGANFTGATAVKFGATNATSYSVNNATKITAVAPARSAGTVDVTVTTPGGISQASPADQYTYASTPTVTSVSPPAGPTAGGNTVTITGTGFSGASGVSFGSTAATGFTVNSATSITATAPSGTVGTVDVTVSTPGGTSVTGAADRFTYNAPLQPSSPPPAPIPSIAPVVSGGSPTTETSNGTAVAGTVNPESLATTAFFQYGLDPSERGPDSSTTLYDQSTPVQQVGSDTADHTISAPLAGLVPGALYHIRIVATNSAGTTLGPDVTFTTPATPALPPPVLGNSENAAPVSGTVYIKTPTGFVKLTGNEQIPSGAEIDALGGSLKITTATSKKHETQHGIFGGAVFILTQTRSGASKGLVTLSLAEGAFAGAPTYATCKPHKALDATAASSRTLQLLHASAHGKFRTKGRYSAATVLGTKWTVADRCDGTLTHDITDSVAVTDFAHHKTIILHAGQSYLAKP